MIPTNKYLQAGITWLMLLATLAVNALAAILPINGMTPGAISDMYPNRFVPDGFTFSIWSLIYLALLSFLAYANRMLIWCPAEDERRQRVTSVLGLFWLTCVLNMGWLLAWHYLQITLSLGIMILLLVTLLAIFARLVQRPASFWSGAHWMVEIPMTIYLGWISVATMANAAAWLVHLGFHGGGLPEELWAAVLIVLAGAAGVFMAIRHRSAAYGLVIAWALWGIYRAQHEDSALIGKATMAMIGMVLAVVAIAPWRKRQVSVKA